MEPRGLSVPAPRLSGALSEKRWATRFLGAPLTTGLVAALLLVGQLGDGIGPSADNAKFQYLGEVLGTPHATGYPTYVLMNAAWVRLLPGSFDLALGSNLLSVVVMAATAVLLVAFLGAVGVPRTLAAVTALWWISSPAVLRFGLFAEVYGLHALLAVAIWRATLGLDGGRARGGIGGPLAIGWLVGLALGNHMTAVFLLPGWTILLWGVVSAGTEEDRKLRGMLRLLFLVASSAAATTMVLYLYPFWRTADPTTRYLEMSTPDLASFAWYATGAQFRDFLPDLSLRDFTRALAGSLQVGWSQLDWLWLPAGLGASRLVFRGRGLARTQRPRVVERPAAHWWVSSTVVAGGLPLLFASAYRIPDAEGYYVAPLLFLSLAASWACAALIGSESASAGSRTWAYALGVLAACVWMVTLRLPAAGVEELNDQARERRRFAESLVDLAIRRAATSASSEPKVVIVARDSPTYQALQYLALGQRRAGSGAERMVYIATPLVSEQFALRVQDFVQRHDPPAGPRTYFDAGRGAAQLVDGLRAGRRFYLVEERLELRSPDAVLLPATFADEVAAAGATLEPAAPGWFWLSANRESAVRVLPPVETGR